MEKRKKKYIYLTFPAVLLILAFIGVPFVNAIRLSFFKWNGYSQNMKFIGTQNFITLVPG